MPSPPSLSSSSSSWPTNRPLSVKLCVCLVLAACFLGAHALLLATLLVLLRVDRWSVWNVLLVSLVCGGVLLSMVRTCAGVVRRVWHHYHHHHHYYNYSHHHHHHHYNHIEQQQQEDPWLGSAPASPFFHPRSSSSSALRPSITATTATATTTTTTTAGLQDVFARHVFDLLLPLLQWRQRHRAGHYLPQVLPGAVAEEQGTRAAAAAGPSRLTGLSRFLAMLMAPPPPQTVAAAAMRGDQQREEEGDLDWPHLLAHLRLGMLGRELSAEDYEDLLRLDEHDIEARQAARGLGIGELRRLPLFRIPQHTASGSSSTGGGGKQQQQQQQQTRRRETKKKGGRMQEEEEEEEEWGSAVVVDLDNEQQEQEEEEEEYDILTRGLSIVDCGEELGAKLLSRHCPICLLTYCAEDVVCTLPLCLHRFHFGCVARWLQMNDRCPVCQQQAICDMT